MAEKAIVCNRLSKSRQGTTSVTRCQIPLTARGVVGNGGLHQVAADVRQDTLTHMAGADREMIGYSPVVPFAASR